MKIPLQRAKYRGLRCGAFTLVEMLAVMGIMLIMLGMLLPAINGALGSKGRKGAVSILLNTFEQARVAALEQSTNVYVGFADGSIPNNGIGARNEGFAYTRFIVFRDRIDDIDGASAPKYIPLTKWLALPKGISFKSDQKAKADSFKSNSVLGNPTVDIGPDDKFPGINTIYHMPAILFNNTGMIEKPTSNLSIYLYEGFWNGVSDTFTRSNYGSLYDKITFSRFTGRAQLDITSAS